MSNQSLTYKQVRTKKKHLCDMCGKRIRKGVLAWYATGVYEDEFYARYMHGICEHLWSTEIWPDSDECIDPAEFYQDVLRLPLIDLEQVP